MNIIVLGGKEWVLRHARGEPIPAHYSQRRLRHVDGPRVTTLCGLTIGSDAEPSNADVRSDDVCPECWKRSMARSAKEARKKMRDVWKGSGARLVAR